VLERPVVFALLVAGAAVFVWLTAASMPPVVASHFDASGVANGSMPRGFYIRFMAGLIVALPALLAITSYSIGRPNARINLPNRDYWLAPERRDQTIAYLRQYLMRFGAMLVVFLCYVHWLVVRANEIQPPRLSNRALFAGLIVFLVYALVWTRLLLRRFGNRSGSG
jgi:hypothetical protein